MQYPHLMIDLETYGQKPGCVILSLGACLFDPFAHIVGQPQIGPSFYVVFDRNEQMKQGNRFARDVNADTVEWWSKQSEEAKKVFDEKQTPVDKAFDEFQEFLLQFGVEPKDLQVWGNGADFDNVLLDDLYSWADTRIRPWGTYNNRCFRTLKTLHRKFYDAAVVALPRTGAHNAQADAEWQAKIAVRIIRKADAAIAVADAACVLPAPDGELYCVNPGPERDELQTAIGAYEHS